MSYEDKIKECENIRIESTNIIQELLYKLKDSVEQKNAKESKEYAMQINNLAMKNIQSIESQSFYEKRMYDESIMKDRVQMFHKAIQVIRSEMKKIKEIITDTFGNKRKKYGKKVQQTN